MLYKRTSKQSSILVDLSPLIDVVFLLLIFFMVSTRFRDDAGMDLTLPSSQSRQQAKVEFLIIVMDKNMDIKVGEKIVTMAEVKGAIEEGLKDFEKKMVVLKVDQSIDHGTVIKLMDSAKGANAEGITFSTSAPTGSTR